MENKIVVVIMGQDCEKFIGMCLEGVKDADAIVYLDGGSTDGTLGIVADEIEEDCDGDTYIKIIENKYNQEDLGMNGKQRNFYLDYVKKNYPGWWCLVLDPDEIVDDFSKIRYFIDTVPKQNHDILFSLKMRHLIGDLGHEDATQPTHFVPHRLFKIREGLIYKEIEHPVLMPKPGKDGRSANVQPTTIWHLAYVPNMWEIKKRYENHLKKSQSHTKEYLNGWYRAHLFGQYPKGQINLNELPKVLLDEFKIDKDEIYFANRGLETKHFIMCKNWINYFRGENKKVLDIGAGFGHYGFVLKEFFNCSYNGFDISKWAIKNTPYKNLDIRQGDITGSINFPDSNYDLVLCIDILEHLEKKDLDKTLKLISELGKQFIFSIPFLGDPHLDADPTHIIKENKDWWFKKLAEYFHIIPTPKDWLFHEQILVGEKI